jgi:hypothetical protein
VTRVGPDDLGNTGRAFRPPPSGTHQARPSPYRRPARSQLRPRRRSQRRRGRQVVVEAPGPGFIPGHTGEPCQRLPETALRTASRCPTPQRSAAPFTCAVAWVDEVVHGDVNHPHINGMQGQGFKSPQLHHHLPAETARPATPAAGPTPEKTPIRRDHSPASLLPGDSRSWASGSRFEARNPCRWACARALPTRFERHRPLDRRYGPRADYPIAGAWAARACGIAVTWVGRPAPIFTLVVARPGAARGYGALVTALLWS